MKEVDQWHLATDFTDASAASARRAAVIGKEDLLGHLITDTADQPVRYWLTLLCPNAAQICVVDDSEFDVWLSTQRAKQSDQSTIKSLGHLATTKGEILQVDSVQIDSESNAVVRRLSVFIQRALESNASDIHFEQGREKLVIQYRRDGALWLADSIQDASKCEQILSRIKVLAQLDITEQRLPQDGRFSVSFCGRVIDIRVSILPSMHGEDAVLRLLDKSHLVMRKGALALASLGFDDAIAAAIRAQCVLPYGMVLLTGPTGSGKTTTLYTVLEETKRTDEKIVSIEDPVEYQMAGVLQVPVNEAKGLTFARGLRAILRHDPDRILVGEIRDNDTAQIAVQAAMTGHLVYTTIHANNAIDVLDRIQQLGVARLDLVGALNAVIGQRLIRLICKFCEGHGVKNAQTCQSCSGSGFAGRKAIGELIVFDAKLKAALRANVDRNELLSIIVAQEHYHSLRDQALALVASGLTNQSEADRVTSTQ